MKHATQVVLVAILDRFRINLLALKSKYEYIEDAGCLDRGRARHVSQFV